MDYLSKQLGKTLADVLEGAPAEVINTIRHRFFTDLQKRTKALGYDIRDEEDILKIPAATLEELKQEILDEWDIRLAHGSVGSAKVFIAQKPDTLPHVLHVLSLDKDDDVREAVAGNESTDQDDLDHLSEDKKPHVQAAVASNRKTRPTTLGKLAIHEDDYVRCSVAENPSCDAATRNLLLNDPSRIVREFVAWNENLPKAQRDKLLRELTSFEEKEGRTYIYEKIPNPSVFSDEELVRAMANHPSPSFRELAAICPSLPQELLDRLMKDPDPKVGVAAFRANERRRLKDC